MIRSQSPFPWVARTLLPRDLGANAMMAVALGSLEGGLVAVIVKSLFAAVVEPGVVNLAVALVAGAPALANVASLMFASLAHGRDKPLWVAFLMAVAAGALGVMALAPVSAAGLVLITSAMIAGRLAWAGVITLRAAIWRANYPRHVRARITSRITLTYSVIMALAAGVIGVAMEFSSDAWRWLFPLAAAFGMAAAWRYRTFRLRGARRLREAESGDGVSSPGDRLRESLRILKGDVWYRRYMMTMFMFGSGNLMVIALLVIILTEQFAFARFEQVLITTTIPLMSLALFMPWWARRLDAAHILDYRARQSWGFVLALGLFTVAASARQPLLFWAGAVALGAAFAGGQLGWNLGHNDFTSDARSTLYMGIHVTLTGIRGLFAPLVAVGGYQWLESLSPGAGRHVLFFPFMLTLGGALTFVRLARRRRREMAPGC